MTAPNPFTNLAGQQYMSLTTFRKTGQAVATPVWFAEAAGKLYVTTNKKSGKVRRLRNNPAVTVAPSTAGGQELGPTARARARVLAPAEAAPGKQALLRKYGWQYRFFALLWKIERRVYIILEITPE